MPSSGHHTLLAFEIVTPPIVAPSLTCAVPTCTPRLLLSPTLGTPATAARRLGSDDVTPHRMPFHCPEVGPALASYRAAQDRHRPVLRYHGFDRAGRISRPRSAACAARPLLRTHAVDHRAARRDRGEVHR